MHSKNKTFFGLRADDLRLLEGKNSIVCFLWDKQEEPLFIVFNEFEEIFSEIKPASDGQYKAQVYLNKEYTELYIANAGKFNVEAFVGGSVLKTFIEKHQLTKIPDYSHSQIQTLLGSIGTIKVSIYGFRPQIETS